MVYSKNEHETGDEWVIMQMLYWDNYERIDSRWYFRRRLPCYWYATDLNAPPIGDNKMRWPDGSITRARIMSSGRPGRSSGVTARYRFARGGRARPAEQFLTTMRRDTAEPKFA